ncbi:MAG: RraA family protein [Burkholderiales bacterium]
MDSKAISARLLKLDSGALSDVFDSMGLFNQVLSMELRPVSPGMRVAGPAFCIRGVSAAGGAPVTPPQGKAKPAFEIDRHATEGCIAVIETGHHREGAVIGGNVSLGYMQHGCRGAIVDGPVRDVPEFVDQGFMVFAPMLSPMSSKGRWAFLDYNVPITMPGHVSNAVRVDPGDYVFGDAEGCLVIPGALVEQVVGYAEELIAVEGRMQAGLRKGVDREKVYADHNPRAHVKPAAR